MQVLTSSHLSMRQRSTYLLSELISRILHPTTLFLALPQLAEGDICKTWRTRIQHYEKTESNEQTALLEMEGFPLPFCNILFSAFPFALQLCRSPTPSLVLTPALVQVESKYMQFTTPAELKKPQQNNNNETQHPTPRLLWKQARISVGTFSRIERNLSALNWFKCRHKCQSQLKVRGEERRG